MTLSRAQKNELKILFKQQDRLKALDELMEGCISSKSLVLKTSKRSDGSMELHESPLFRLIQGWAKEELGKVEARLEAL